MPEKNKEYQVNINNEINVNFIIGYDNEENGEEFDDDFKFEKKSNETYFYK